jgi:hypothetical protein
MNLKKFAKPWQAMPSRIISLALVHARQDTDFDQQLAFLLLDVGVEAALKTYLINRKQDVEKIFFPDLLKRVGEELRKDNLNIPLDEIEYFHKTRNKLYHQGDGVKPTEENLEKYAELAKTLVKTLLDVELDEPSEQDSHRQLLSRIRKNIASLEANSALIAEHLYPYIATRKIEAQLRHIRITTGPDDQSNPPSVRAEFTQQRIDAFNTITGWELSEDNHELIESIIDNPEQFYVWLAFEEIDKSNWRKEWMEYRSVADFLKREQNASSAAEEGRYEKMDRWVEIRAKSVHGWVKASMSDVSPKEFVPRLEWLEMQNDE